MGQGRGTQLSAGLAAVIAIGLLSGCGLYLHDPSLQASAESTRSLVLESDLSKQINGQLTGAADLAQRQEIAVINFYVMRRNQQFLRLLQPDVLEEAAFADSGDTASYLKSGGGYVRNPADLRSDIEQAINCRLDELLVGPACGIDPNTLLPAKATVRDASALITLRNSTFPEIQFANATGLDINVQNARAQLLDAIRQQEAAEPDLPEDPRGKMACGDIGAETREEAKNPDLTQLDNVGALFFAYALACENAELGHAAAEPVLKGRPNSALDKAVTEITALRTEREKQQREGFRLAIEMRALMKQIAAAQGAGPAESAFQDALAKAQKALKEANGAAKLFGLRELADQTDALLQIELNNAAAGSSGAAPAATPPEAEDSVTAKGQALVQLASAGARAADAYRDEAPVARAQELIIARAVLTQQIEVASLQVSLIETKLLLLIAQRDFMLNEVHELAEAGRYLDLPQIESSQTSNALKHFANAWDGGQIEEQTITWRVFAAERETSIRISASNAKNMQAAVLAASDQIVAYTQGGLTKEALAQALAELLGLWGVAGGLVAK